MRKWLEAGDFDVPIEHYLPEVWENNTGSDAQYRIKWKTPQDKQEVVDLVRQVLARLEVKLRADVLPYRYEPELRFTSSVGVPAPNGETIFVEMYGAIDIAVLYPDDTVGVFDLKVSKDSSYIRSCVDQLVFYDLCLRNWLGVKPVKHGFYAPLLTDPYVGLDVTDEDRARVVSDVTTFAHTVWGNTWALTENRNHCFNCEVKHACPRFRSPLSVEQQNANLRAFGT